MAKRARMYWLMKSEPDEYSIDDLQRDTDECCPRGRCSWDGVRNYQARNFMREMAVGDLVLFYHSSTKPPGVAGVAEVCRAAYPDHTQFDPKSKYYDPKSKEAEPRWSMVDLQYVEHLAFISLATLKDTPALAEMKVVQKGSRLSVQPVRKAEFKAVVKLGKGKTRVR